MPQSPPPNLVSQTWSGPPRPPGAIPETADIVIVGAGIVGISTAWFLARQGIDVVVCEKGHVAGEQSGRNWGWVRQQSRDTRELPMIVESLRIWRGLSEAIGEDVGFREHGVVYPIESERQRERFSRWLKAAEGFEIGSRLIEAGELDGLIRGATARWRGALYTAGDGRAEPHKATPALARAAVREGAAVLTACAVRGIESSAGRVSAVVTEHGSIRTSTVLCAAGAWTSMFCRSLGIVLPQLKVRGTVARTAPSNAVVCDGNMIEGRLALRRRLDGGYTLAHGTTLEHLITPSSIRFGPRFLPALRMEMRNLRLSLGSTFAEEWSMPKTWPLDEPSPFEKCRVLDPEPNRGVLRQIRENTDQLFPELAAVPIVESWAGMIEMTPDVIPVIDRSEALPGFYMATGFSGHGFGIGPGAGKAIAGLLTGNDTGIDLSEFRLGRFFDGTPVRPQTSV